MAVTKARQVEITSCRHRPFTSLFMYVKQTKLPRIQLREILSRKEDNSNNAAEFIEGRMMMMNEHMETINSKVNVKR